MKQDKAKIKTLFVVDPMMDIDGYYKIKEFFHLNPTTGFIAPVDHAAVTERVLNYHHSNQEDLIRIGKETEALWRTKEEEFVRLASRLFSVESFPKSAYSCYPTIWPLIARDPLLLRIAFPATGNAQTACYVIAHELLHELFFRHVHKLLPDLDLNGEVVFILSEVFNVFVLESTEWQQVFPYDVQPYSDHKKIYTLLKPVWDQKVSIEAFILEALPMCVE